jgi:hypothetical protein
MTHGVDEEKHKNLYYSIMDLLVSGRIHDRPDDGSIWYVAASPPDYRTSFTGSGLPFASPQQAFDHSPNRGQLKVREDGHFEVSLLYPNSYYADLGNQLIPPTLYMMYTRGGTEVRKSVCVGSGVPYRSLDHPKAREDATFYAAPKAMKVRGQDNVLTDSGYPAHNREAQDFWGGKPPL